MRGAVDYEDIMMTLTYDDKKIISDIVKENIETVSKTGLPIL